MKNETEVKLEIEQLEERIAPATLTITPRAGSAASGVTATVNAAAVAANGHGVVTVS